MLEYKLILDFDSGSFTDRINAALSDGWELYGDLKTPIWKVSNKSKIGFIPQSYNFIQAMTRMKQEVL